MMAIQWIKRTCLMNLCRQLHFNANSDAVTHTPVVLLLIKRKSNQFFYYFLCSFLQVFIILMTKSLYF